MEGRVYSVDVIGHHEPLNWHGTKQDADEPLAGVEISRSEIWGRWFAEESALVTTINERSMEVLKDWQQGQIDYAFLDGSHEYEDVMGELEALDSLMTEGGVIVVDDFHLGVVVYRVRSRLLNAIPGVNRTCAGRRIWPRVQELVAPSEREQRVRDRQAEAFRRKECGRGVRGGAGWPVVARDSLDAFAGRVPRRRLFAGGAQEGDCGGV